MSEKESKNLNIIKPLTLDQIKNLSVSDLPSVNQYCFDVYTDNLLDQIDLALEDLHWEKIVPLIDKLVLVYKDLTHQVTNESKEKIMKICLKLAPFESLQPLFEMVWFVLEKICPFSRHLFLKKAIKNSKLSIKESTRFINKVFVSIISTESISEDQIKILLDSIETLKEKFQADFIYSLPFAWNLTAKKFYTFLDKLIITKHYYYNSELKDKNAEIKEKSKIDIINLIMIGIGIEFNNRNFEKVIQLEKALKFLYPRVKCQTKIYLIFAESYIKSIGKAEFNQKIIYENEARKYLNLATELGDITNDSPTSVIHRFKSIKDLLRILDYGDEGSAGVLSPRQPALF